MKLQRYSYADCTTEIESGEKNDRPPPPKGDKPPPGDKGEADGEKPKRPINEKDSRFSFGEEAPPPPPNGDNPKFTGGCEKFERWHAIAGKAFGSDQEPPVATKAICDATQVAMKFYSDSRCQTETE